MATSVIAKQRGSRPDEIASPVALWLLTTPGLILSRLAILAVALVAGQRASRRVMSKYWLSSPLAIGLEVWHWALDGSLWLHLRATLTEMGLGYVIGCVCGIALGLVLGFLPRVYRVVLPFLSGLYCLPKIALAPLFVIVLGIDLGSKVALVAITVFFLILYSTLDGIRDIDRDLALSLRLMGATRREVSLKAVS